MRNRRGREKSEPDVPVSSFSDIAFLLIIFFILVTSLQQLQGITTEIPSGQKSDAPPEKNTIVNIAGDQIALNDDQISLESLRAALADMDLHNKTGNDKIVMLEATGNVSYQLYYDVITSISHAGGALAIVPEE